MKEKTYISLEEAQARLLGRDMMPIGQEILPLERAYGRILAENIVMPFPQPPFAKSPLDGYAMRAADLVEATRTNPAKLAVIEEIHAGHVAAKTVTAGTAIKLMTGSMLPSGADIVIRYEDIRREGDYIQVFSPLAAGQNVIPAGEDLSAGEIVAGRGMRLTPALIAAVAATGRARVNVCRQPVVAVLSTGDELVLPGEALVPGKIYDTNLYAIAAACEKTGACVIRAGNIVDRRRDLRSGFETALAQADIVITTGGVSVGDYDLVPEVIGEIGGQLLFHGVKLKPGSPVLAASCRGKTILALSGNPAAAVVTFQLLGVPLLRKLGGAEELLAPRRRAVLRDSFRKESRQRRFLQGHLQAEGTCLVVALAGTQGNGALKSMLGADVLVDLPAGTGPLAAGAEVDVLLTGEL